MTKLTIYCRDDIENSGRLPNQADQVLIRPSHVHEDDLVLVPGPHTTSVHMNRDQVTALINYLDEWLGHQQVSTPLWRLDP